MPRRPQSQERLLSRRKAMALLGTTGAAGLAGCLGDGDTDGTDDTAPADDGDDTADPGDDDGDDIPGDDSEPDPDLQTEGELVGPDGDQVELTIAYTTGTESYETVAELIAQGLEEVGIASSIEGLEWSSILSQVVANEYVGEGEPEWNWPNNAGPREDTESDVQWDIHYGINFNSYPRTPASKDVFWYESGPVNYYGYAPEVDLQGKYADFRVEPDQEARQEIFNDILLTLNEDQPVNFVVMLDDLVGYNERVGGPEATFGGNWDSTQTNYFDDPSVGGDYIYALSSGAETLYFPEIVDTTSAAFVGLTLDGAYGVNENNEVEPFWLDFYDTGDGQVFVAELRDNLEWGAGYGQMTAEDWIYYIDEVQQATLPDDEKDNWAGSADQAEWDVVENIEQTGELEFQLELGSVNPDFPLEPVMWGTYCAPMDLFEEYRPDTEALQQSDVIQELAYTGNLGPYDFETWDRDDRFVATRADEYYARDIDDRDWDDVPYFDSFTYRIISEESTRLQALRAGEIHGAGIPEARFREFDEEVDNVWVNQVPQPYMRIMAMNMRRNGWDQFRKREIRQAFSMILDKEVVADQVLRGMGAISHTHQPTWSGWWDESIEDEIIEFGVGDAYDTQRARQIIAEYTDDDYEYSG